MARFDIDGKQADALIRSFDRLGVALNGEVSEAVLQAGAAMCKADWQSAAASAGYTGRGKSGRGTGTMLKSVAYTKVKDGAQAMRYVDIYPMG